MITLHRVFDTEAEAIAWRDEMYQAYHPLGYGTHLQIAFHEERTMPDGTVVPARWVAWGSRAESCD